MQIGMVHREITSSQLSYLITVLPFIFLALAELCVLSLGPWEGSVGFKKKITSVLASLFSPPVCFRIGLKIVLINYKARRGRAPEYCWTLKRKVMLNSAWKALLS